MAIKIVWTANGQIMGDMSVEHDGIHIENPVFLAPGPQGVSMMPVLMFSDEKVVILPIEEAKFGGQLFEPITELRNHYSSQFGSGLQLLAG